MTLTMDKDLLIAICDRIKDSVPAIRWVDAEDSQLESADRPAVAFPCALVDIAYEDCRTHIAGQQRVTASVTVRVGFQRSAPSNASAPMCVRQLALSRLDALQAIHKALQWWNGGGLFNPLRRKSCTPEKRSGPLKVYTMRYITEFSD